MSPIIWLTAIYPILGWLILLAADWYTDTQWVAWFETLQCLSPQQIEIFNRDTASKAVTLIFGLPISFAYVFILWLLCNRAIALVAHRVGMHVRYSLKVAPFGRRTRQQRRAL